MMATGISSVGLVKTNLNPDFFCPIDPRTAGTGLLGFTREGGVGETLLGVGDIDRRGPDAIGYTYRFRLIS